MARKMAKKKDKADVWKSAELMHERQRRCVRGFEHLLKVLGAWFATAQDLPKTLQTLHYISTAITAIVFWNTSPAQHFPFIPSALSDAWSCILCQLYQCCLLATHSNGLITQQLLRRRLWWVFSGWCLIPAAPSHVDTATQKPYETCLSSFTVRLVDCSKCKLFSISVVHP